MCGGGGGGGRGGGGGGGRGGGAVSVCVRVGVLFTNLKVFKYLKYSNQFHHCQIC